MTSSHLSSNLFSNKYIALVLIVLNATLFSKLDFFLPQLSGQNALLDFDTYFHLATDIKSGINPYTVNYMQTLGPPLVFIYFLPFSFLALQTAKTLTIYIYLVSGFTSCWILAKHYYQKNIKVFFLLFTLILFSSFPARFSIENGQLGLVVALLVTWILKEEKLCNKGIVLGLLIALKTYFIFSIFAFIKNNRKVLLATIASLAILLLISFTLIKPAWYVFYLQNKLPQLISTAKLPSGVDYYNQSLKSTFHRLGLSNIYRPMFPILIITTTLLIFVTGNFELSVIFAILLSPVSWQHYYVVLFPIFVKTMSKVKNDPKLLLVLLTSVVLWWTEFPRLHQANLTFINGLFASHYFFSGLILALTILHLTRNANPTNN